jgi:uncharacterized protein YukE
MSSGYEVDIDQLQATVAKLRGIADSLEQPKSSARYDTTIAGGVLGQGFTGAGSLTEQHNEMAQWLESMIGALQSFIDTYGTQTKQAADTYTSTEDQTRQDFFSSGH